MITIRRICPQDIPACTKIYNFYIRETSVTFEETPLSADEFGDRVARICGDGYPYLVAIEQGRAVGFAYLDKYSPRTAYRFTADLSIYVDSAHISHGIGRALYGELEVAARDMGLRSIVSIITDTNRPSVDFHEHHGFSRVGALGGVGYKFDRWLGIVIYQKHI